MEILKQLQEKRDRLEFYNLCSYYQNANAKQLKKETNTFEGKIVDSSRQKSRNHENNTYINKHVNIHTRIAREKERRPSRHMEMSELQKY